MNTLNRNRNARVEQHLAIVDPVARHYAASSGQDQEDLRQVGLLGLLRAAGPRTSNLIFAIRYLSFLSAEV